MTKAIPISSMPFYSKRYFHSLLTVSTVNLSEDDVEPNIPFFWPLRSTLIIRKRFPLRMNIV